MSTLTGNSSRPTPDELREDVRRRIGTNASEMCAEGLKHYKNDNEHFEPLWKLLSHGVSICEEVLQSEVLYTALVSRGALEREGVVTTWSRHIKLITQRAYKSIVRQKTAKNKRMLAIESLETIEKNLKWFVGFLKGYMGNFDAFDDSEAVNAVHPHYEGLDRIANEIKRFLADSAELKEKAREAE